MRKKLLLILLALVSTICMAFAFASCDDTTTSKNDGWGNAFTVETAYAHAQELGYEGTLEEFLASIQGKDGKDAVGIKTVVVDNQGDLIITLTDDTIINAGSVKEIEQEPEEYYTEGLHYLLNEDKQSYSVADIGMAEDCDIYIPSIYKGKPVTGIKGLFPEYYRNNDYLSIYIPSSIKFISESSLYTDTISVYYLGTLTEFLDVNIGYHSWGVINFYIDGQIMTDKSKPYSITIPNTVTKINDCQFVRFNGLQSVIFEDNSTCESIGSRAFWGCSSLQTVTFGENSQLTSIGDSAFYNCSSLTSITIPDKVTSISNYAFYNCSTLTSITIPDSVTSIDYGAFQGCDDLTSVTFENTSGWYVYPFPSLSESDRKSVTVTDSTQNAMYLKSTYYYYYWKRK